MSTKKWIVPIGLNVLLIVLGAASTVRAESVTLDQVFDIPYTPTNITTSFNVSKFDPSLGTLTGVYYGLSASVKANASVSAISGPGIYTFTAASTLRLKAPGGATNVITLLPSNDDDQLIAAAPFNYGTNVASDSTSLTKTDAAFLPQFIGSGTINIPFTAVGTSGVYGPGTVATTITQQVTSQATFHYTFTPVPEPGTTSLVIAGLGTGVAMLARKRLARRG